MSHYFSSKDITHRVWA